MNKAIPQVSYGDLAHEYYDAERHPTCANFRTASRILLSQWLEQLPLDGQLLEVGSGRSLFAEWLAMRRHSLGHLLIGDSSALMLAYSTEWKAAGAWLLLANAYALPLRTGCITILVSSLGDPYNTRVFWQEAARVLQPGGMLIFTTPSEEWARTFRQAGCPFNKAEFLLATGQKVLVPSFITSKTEQVKWIETVGLTVQEIDDIPIAAIPASERSSKLCSERGPDASIVTGYLVQKSPQSMPYARSAGRVRPS